MMRSLAGGVLAAGLLAFGCNQPFQPDGGYDARLVVYGILSVPADTQYVRIGRTSTTGATIDVSDAAVEIVPGNGDPVVRLRDTVVMHTDPAGTVAPYHVYAAYNFAPKSRVVYQVNVVAAGGGTAGGTALGLGPADVTLVNPGALTSSSDSLVILASFGQPSGAYVVHLYVDYLLTSGGTTTGGSVEVPVATTVDASGAVVPAYPSFERVPVVVGTATTSTLYPRALYAQTVARLLNGSPGSTVMVTGAHYSLTQIDDALYDYYYVRNGPKDTSTLRLDVPDFTNVAGGLGVIGCMQIVTRAATIAP